MNRRLWKWRGLPVLCALAVVPACRPARRPPRTAEVEPKPVPRVWVASPEVLLEARSRVADGDPVLQPAYERLMIYAEEALGRGPWSVTDKLLTPPSGDKRDYLSIGPYWWPNPDTPDGLPYVRRDGEWNPQRDDESTDGRRLGTMSAAVEGLSLAYFLSGDERFAAHAARILRTWFLDPDTRMNPHLDYGQAIPGVVEGRGIGIIDTDNLLRTVDGAGLLAGSAAWTDEEQVELEAWFSDYLDWLKTSSHGRDEAAQPNNHGTYFDRQAAVLALFAGRDDMAREILRAVPDRRIAPQIEPDGAQPRELSRTLSLHYSVYNLTAFVTLANLGCRFDLDLWRWTDDDGRGLRVALEYVLAHVEQGTAWPHPQIRDFDPGRLSPLLLQAARALEDPRYEALFHRLAEYRTGEERYLLFWPPPAPGSPNGR